MMELSVKQKWQMSKELIFELTNIGLDYQKSKYDAFDIFKGLDRLILPLVFCNAIKMIKQ